MIDNPTKIKDLIKNLSKGDSGKAQLLQRRYVMERFLERISVSEYRKNLVLKGGMLVTSLLDIGERMTRDTDVTMLDKNLNVESALDMVSEIASIELDDATSFDIKDAYEIMEDSEYGGVRIELEAHFGKSRIPMKLDISTGDALTPSAINYSYGLMLEDREIEVLAYNIETMLAEKIETMLFRSTLNSRMRDFYDIWALSNLDYAVDEEVLAEAINATAVTRGHRHDPAQVRSTMDALTGSDDMYRQWTNFQARNDFARNVSWEEVLQSAKALCDSTVGKRY